LTAGRAEAPPVSNARWVNRIAYGLIAAQLAWRAWAGYRSYFWQDDFVYVWHATKQPLSLAYLLQDYHGHLMPGQFLIVWISSRLAPMDHAVVALICLGLQAVADVAAYRLLRLLFGARVGVLVPLSVFLFCPLTLTAFLWWAAALQAIPLQIAMLVALHAQVRYLRSGRLGHALLGVLATAGGLFFWQKALLIVPVVFAVTALFFAPATGLRRVTWTVRVHRRLWLVYAALVVTYLGIYAAATRQRGTGPGSAAAVFELAGNAMATFVTGLLGGAWSADFVGPTLAAQPATAALWVAWQLAALIVLASLVVRGWQAVRAWGLVVGYLAVVIVLVAISRLDFIGPLIGRDPRYITDAVAVAALAVGFAFMPDALAPSPRPSRRWEAVASHPLAIGGLVLVYLNSCAVTSVLIADSAPSRDARNYVSAARLAIRQDPNLVLYDGPVPEFVISSIFTIDARASRVVGALPERPRFNQPTSDLRMLDGFGQSRQVDVLGVVSTRQGPAPDCGWPVRQPGATIPFPSVTPSGESVLRIGYFTGTAAPAVVRTGGQRFSVRFDQGLHQLYLVVDGPLSALDVSGLDRGAAVCITDAAVGRPWPKQDH
jgi:hypothetical protein